MGAKTILKKRNIILILLIVSLGFNIYLFSQLINLKNTDLYYNKATPDIELGGVMIFYGTPTQTGEKLEKPADGFYGYGNITGYVAFNNISQQPRGTRQYYTIYSSEDLDSTGKQIFYLVETIKMSAVSPREFEPEPLYVRNDNKNMLLLETKGGTRIKFSKQNQTISLDDGEAKLITNHSDFRDYIVDLYR